MSEANPDKPSFPPHVWFAPDMYKPEDLEKSAEFEIEYISVREATHNSLIARAEAYAEASISFGAAGETSISLVYADKARDSRKRAEACLAEQLEENKKENKWI